jgi:protein-L-isoaspartate(D-aspartate) O-methyltransferase
MPAPLPLELCRRFYAEELRAVAGLKNERLVEAFARVPREAYLGPGPWRIAGLDMMGTGVGPNYRATPDADPRHLYHDVAIAIDLERNLNNGHPATLAIWLDSLDLRPGARVYHLGCGVGYYTAIIAEVVGPGGHVLAAEVDPQLAERARQNLAGYSQVEVVSADGATLDPGSRDAIFINAGVTHPQPQWLDNLRASGILLLPLTATMGPSNLGKGVALRVQRTPEGFPARASSFLMIYSCSSGRNAELNTAIAQALSSWGLMKVQSLRRDAHERAQSCVLHGTDFCLSTEPVQRAAAG